MLNVDVVIAGFVLSLIALAMKSMQSMRSELKESLRHETEQNNKINDNFHKIQLLEKDVEILGDKLITTSNGLLERITHNRSKLDERLNHIEGFLNREHNYGIRKDER